MNDVDVREHISHKTTRGRVELQLRRSGRPLLVYAVGLALMFASLAVIASNLRGGGGVSSTRTVAFEVADATGVVAGRAEARYKGIPAGTLSKVELRDGRAVLTAKLDSRWGEIYRDARANLRPGTPLQDMYLDVIDRGTPAAGRATASDPIALDRTTSSVNVSEVLQVFDADTRVRLRTLLDQFGNGLDDRGASLRTAFVELVPLLQVARRAVDQITVREQRTRRVVHNFALLSDELGRREGELRTLVRDGGATLSTLESRTPELDATITRLAPVLTKIDTTFDAVRGVLPDVDRAVAKLDPVVDVLPGALSAVRDLSTDARPALRALRPSVQALGPLTRDLKPISQQLSKAVNELAPQVGAFDHITTSLGKCGYTIQRFFHWTQSVFALGDAHGEAPRGDAAVGFDTPGVTPAPRTKMAPNCSGATAIGGVPPKEFRP